MACPPTDPVSLETKIVWFGVDRNRHGNMGVLREWCLLAVARAERSLLATPIRAVG
jgi:hypothetical protein